MGEKGRTPLYGLGCRVRSRGMDPRERADLIAAVLKDPEALWAIRTSKVRVAGPWVEAKSESRRRVVCGGFWRLNTRGEEIVTVYPSTKVREPLFSDFVRDWDSDGEPLYTDEDEYDAAIEGYKARLEAWKPFSYSFRVWESARFVYSNTLEEAKAEADKVLTELGVPLKNTDLPADPTLVSRLSLLTE